MNRASQSGNVFFFIMLGLVLFAALSFTVVESTKQTDNTLLSDNEAKLSQGQIEGYIADLNAGKTDLQLAGCNNIDYTPPASQGAGDKSCHMFHPDGAGVTYRTFQFGAGCNLTDLSLGESCQGLVYAGESGGNRLYTTFKDLGAFRWSGGGGWDNTGATSSTDGLSNTNILVNFGGAGAPYEAAEACRSLGPEWYLPSRDELNELHTNRTAIGSFDESGVWYWSSTETGLYNARWQRFDSSGAQNTNGKNISARVRCVRR